MKKRMSVAALSALALLVVLVNFSNDIACCFESDNPSQSHGTTKDGSLVNGKRLPTSGANFQAYGRFPVALGRNSLHGRVRDVVVEAYRRVEETRPELKFKYGECSWPKGGRLRPHATHKNGLSIDFMVPVSQDGDPSVLKTNLANKYGYSVRFDADGRSVKHDCEIDFEALALHLHCLADAADEADLRIWRVIFAPDLQALLFATESGPQLKQRLTFLTKPSKVRHDDHYHVDFYNPDEDTPEI